MTKAVIYARYSSANQRDASIEDQIEVCRRYAERQGWKIIDTYADRAISGANRMRPEYQKLLRDSESGAFDIVLCEALDRLARNLSEVANAFDQLTFHNIALHTVSTGEITQLHVGMLGTMSQLYLSDLRDKTKRGQLGRALQGKIPGGKAFGYDVVEGSKDGGGERRVNPAQALVVKRIFEDYANGHSPRVIAKTLNAEGVAGPGRNAWRDTTIRGQFERGTGILNNAIYIGRLEWNRCSYIKNPKTGKRVARINPREDWEIVEIPDLRIIDDTLWKRVKARQEGLRFKIGKDAQGNALNRAHRRRFLFSGLLQCGVCGSAYTIIGKDRYGCSNHRNKGICDNARSILRREIEHRVFAGLKDKLMAPELVKVFVDEYCREVNRLAGERNAATEATRHDLAGTERRIEGILKAIEDGNYQPTLTERLTQLEARKKELKQNLKAAPETPDLLLHPRLADIYRDKVEKLEEALNEPQCRAEASEVLRSLIERIVLFPTDDGLTAELTGDIASILAACGENNRIPDPEESGSQLSVVAGVGFEPTTFRL